MGPRLSLSLIPERINMPVICMSSFELLGTRCLVLRLQVGTTHLWLQNIAAGRKGFQTVCEVAPPRVRSNHVMFWTQRENFVCQIWNRHTLLSHVEQWIKGEQHWVHWELNGSFVDCSDETQVHIAKHVLKTLCTDVANILFNFLAADLMMSVENPSSLSSEVRQSSHSSCPLLHSLFPRLYWGGGQDGPMTFCQCDTILNWEI